MWKRAVNIKRKHIFKNTNIPWLFNNFVIVPTNGY